MWRCWRRMPPLPSPGRYRERGAGGGTAAPQAGEGRNGSRRLLLRSRAVRLCIAQRQLERCRVQCQVIAPALVPRNPGERIKADRRDARKLAELHRAGLLAEVRPPTPAEEAVRDLCRARDDARADRQRCRHRLGKLLLRRGLHYPGRAWTQAHRRWVNGLTWPHPADRVVLDDYLLAIDQLDARLARTSGLGQPDRGPPKRRSWAR